MNKLRLAIQQKFQLTLQQTAEVGKLLWTAMKEQPLREENEEDDLPDSQHFRRKPQIAEVLDQKANVGVSASSLAESMAVHRNLQELPILAFSNEPVSHLGGTSEPARVANSCVFERTCQSPC